MVALHMANDPDAIRKLEVYAANVRRDILLLWKNWRDCLSGSLSITDLYVAFYLGYSGKLWATENSRPRVIPKSTSFLALTAVLRYAGLLPEAILRRPDPIEFDHTVPSVSANDGNLGHSLAQAIGISKAAKLRSSEYMVFCFMGDGEIQEGVDHPAKFAATMKLDNLCVVVDCNHLQSNFYTTAADHTMDGSSGTLVKLAAVWQAYGWSVIECDGHDMRSILLAYSKAGTTGSPLIIFARTIKGKGFVKIEGRSEFNHGIKDTHLLEEAEDVLTQAAFDDAISCVSYFGQPPARLILPLDVSFEVQPAQRSIEESFSAWFQAVVRFNPARIISINSDNPKIIGDHKAKSFFQAGRPSPHIFAGLNERFALNLARGLSTEGLLPVVISPAVHLLNTVDDWRAACLSRDPVLMVGFSSGATLTAFGRSHLIYRDVAMFRWPDAHVYQPASHEDLILLLKHIYQQPHKTLPGYLRLHGGADDLTYRASIPSAIQADECFKNGFYCIKSCRRDATYDVALVVSGILLGEVLRASLLLEKQGITHIVINAIKLTAIDSARLYEELVGASLVVTIIDAEPETLASVVRETIGYPPLKLLLPLGIQGWGEGKSQDHVHSAHGLNANGIAEICMARRWIDPKG